MQLVRRFRLPALSCAMAVLICELIARPYANMGICDDGPYILMARTLATTGHIVYNGWAAPMIGWQLYLGAAFIKLFGFSFTVVRMSTLLVAMCLAFLLQRTLVRANVSERNATLGTAALVLSPLYLMLSVTYMTDISGLFAIVICLHGCLRALQCSNVRSSIVWLGFAVATNAVFGTARQIAWLGILVMVPSTLWLLRARRPVLIAGAAINLAGAIFIFTCLLWLKHQPYIVPEHLIPEVVPVAQTFWNLVFFLLDIPFLLLAIVMLFLPEIRKSRSRATIIFSVALLGYLGLGMLKRHLHLYFPLEPTQGDWMNTQGMFNTIVLRGAQPIVIHKDMQILLTIASFLSVFSIITSFLRTRRSLPIEASEAVTSWQQMGVLLTPFSIAYTLLLLPSATHVIFDRYLLPLLTFALIYLIRFYQKRIHLRLPIMSLLLVALTGIFGVISTHNLFSLYRARIALAAEIRAAGTPDTSVDNGWEYNFDVELQHSNHINNPTIVIPAHAYAPAPAPPAGTCPVDPYWYDKTPHIHPLYGVSFDPNACYGPAPFAPVHYSRWLASAPGTLYVVRYLPPPTR